MRTANQLCHVRIAFLGPESSGKTTLAQAVARALPGAFVPEYGRAYCERFGNDCNAQDLVHIAAGQLLAEEEAAARHPGLPLVADTDVLTTCTFAELYLGQCPPLLEELARLRSYDITFLLPPSVPHQADAIRLFGHRRQEHFALLQRRLKAASRAYYVVQGQPLTERLAEVLQMLA